MKHQCPVEGFDNVVIELPDQWLVRHNEAFWRAYREAGEVSHTTGLLYGSVAVCDKIDGLPDTPPLEWPLEVFAWLINTVYRDGLEVALNPSKN